MLDKGKAIELVGAENVFDAPEILEEYSKDYSLVPPVKPSIVVRPGIAEEASKIVRHANETKTPVYPCSSQIHFYGSALPKEGGVVIDLRNLNSIKRIFERSHTVWLEAGVRWEQFVPEMEAKGLEAVIPFLPHAKRSVIGDYLEREKPVNPIWEHAWCLRSNWVIYGSEDYVTGSGAWNRFGEPGTLPEGVNPQGPGPLDHGQLVDGSQGTMGIVTASTITIRPARVKDRVFFIISDNLDDLIDPYYWITRRRVGEERLILNNINLATILAEKWPADFDRLRRELPAWTLLVVVSGLKRHPDEKIAYQVKLLNDMKITQFPKMNLVESLPGAPKVEERLPKMLRRPWPEDRTYWKQAWKGGCQSLIFMMTLDRVPKFVDVVRGVAAKHGFAADMGVYLQPVEDFRACQFEFDFYYNPVDKAEVSRVRTLYYEAATAVLEEGGYFTRVYDILPEIVYKKCPDYVAIARKIKKILDPNFILSPGKLCF